MDIIDSKEVLDTQSHIINNSVCYAISMSLRCAVQLGITDIISHHDGPLTLSELLAQLSIPLEKSTQLYRLMRLLTHNGYFALQKNHHGEEGYVVTSLSKLLSSEHQSNFSQMLLFMTDPFLITPCLFIADWFRGTNSTPFEAMHGMTLYEYCKKHSDVGIRFNAGTAISSELVIKDLLQDIKPMLEGFETLVDVGGGTGTVAKAIAEAAPHLRCTVYDRPNVISDIKDINKDITLVAGDMFEFIPSANIILLKSVLVDWSDMECLEILKRCKEAISREDCGKKVIIVGSVMDFGKLDSESMKTQSCYDVYIMSFLSGRERTEIEWKKIFMDAGFTSYKITSYNTKASFGYNYNSIIEVFP